MLLANRSGIPKVVPNSVYKDVDFGAQHSEIRDREKLKQRESYVEAVLNLEPVFVPNSGNEYSNSGFVVAAAMLEKISGKPWEKLIEERIFVPLGMTNSGFGNAAHFDDDRIPTQPWPHKDKTIPVGPDEVDDNSWVIGPSGSVHCSLKDIARYSAMHATRETGPVLKKEETYEFLHTAVPDNESYARGWFVARNEWSGGSAVSHDGSNTMNYCSIWVAPEVGAAVAAFSNCAEDGRRNCMAAIDAVVAEHLK